MVIQKKKLLTYGLNLNKQVSTIVQSGDHHTKQARKVGLLPRILVE